MSDSSADKIRTMVGFAVKSNRLEIGTDNVLRKNSSAEIVIADVFLSKNALAKIERHCRMRETTLIVTNFNNMLPLNKPGCKVIGLTDHNMCELVRSEAKKDNKNYRIIVGGGSLG